MRKIQAFGYLISTLAVIAFIGFLGSLLISMAPEIKRLDHLQIKPSNKEIIIGWQELGQFPGTNSAEKEHLKISSTLDPESKQENQRSWLLQNVASKRRVDARTSLIDTRYLRRHALHTGDKLLFNTFNIEVKKADNEELVLFNTRNKQTAKWTGTELLVNDRSGYGGCEREDGLRQFFGGISDWLHWKLRNTTEQENLRLFSLGGQVACTTRWKHKDLAPDSIRFYWHMDKFWVGYGSDPVRLMVERDEKQQDLKHTPLAVNSEEGRVNRLILGRTHYKLTSNDELLTLEPISNQPVSFTIKLDEMEADEKEEELRRQDKEKEYLRSLSSQGITPIYAKYNWIGEALEADPFRRLSWIALIAIMSFGFVFTQIISAINRRLRGDSAALSHAILTIFSLLFSWLAIAWKGELVAALWILWLCTIWTSFILKIRGRLRKSTVKLWITALLLAGFGSLTLTQLAAGADNTRWLRYATENLFYLTQVCVAITLLSLIPIRVLQGVWTAFVHRPNLIIKIIRSSLLGLILFFLIFQFGLGTEQGIWGIQPVEMAKLLVVILASLALWHVRELRERFSRYYQSNPLARIWLFIWLVIAFAFVSLIIAVGVHDYSPTLIITALLAAYLWLIIPHPAHTRAKFIYTAWGMRLGLVVLPVLIVIGIGTWFYFDPPQYESNIWQSERLRIWSNPDTYPEAARQLIISLSRIGNGGWLGSGWFGANSISMQIPAVQDDFIAAFFMHRFGGFMGVALVLIQLTWLGLLFTLSKRLIQTQGSYEQQASLGILGYILFGLAWIHLLHWLISWSNVLGFLPIMGQPMTWLSAGNSHLLAIGAVTLVLGIFGSWFSEER